MPNLTRTDFIELAGACRVDPRTAQRVFGQIKDGQIPPAVLLVVEMHRRGMLDVTALRAARTDDLLPSEAVTGVP